MPKLYVRRGGAWVHVLPRAWRGTSWVGTLLREAAAAISALIYSGPTWSFYLTAAEAVTQFPNATDRNRLKATGTTNDYHTLQRSFPVTAGTTYTMSIRGQADAVSTFLGFEFYSGATFLASAGDFNPTTGVASGTGTGTLTDLGGGVYRYDKTYAIPAGVTTLIVRLLMANAAAAASFIPSGEAILVSELTLT